MRTIAAGLAALVVATGAAPRAQFRGTVDVVEVTATVTDGRGRFLTGLRANDFVVREDGVAQRLSASARTVNPSASGWCSTPAAACKASA